MTTRLLNTQRIVNLSSDPISGTSGEVYYNTATNSLKVYTGSSWSNVGGSSFPSQTGNSGKFLSTNGTEPSWNSVTKTTVGLSNVENTALSTWAGSTNITNLGTISTGTWQGSSISTTHTAAKVTSVNGSTGAITGLATLASPTFTGTVTAPTLSLTTADTATAATHYMVETGTDGIVRPKTLANTRTEIVTTAAVNSAAATTVGTISSGTWQGTAINATYIDSAIARLASPTFTGTPAAPTAAVNTNTTQIATTAFVNAEIANDALGKSGIQVITQAAGSTINTAGQVNTFQILQPTAQADAFITFHISGDYAAHFGIDGTTNDLSYGGWSAGANKYRVWHAGNQATLFTSPTFTGTVILPTSATGGASARIPHGTAPSSPTNGDIWTTTTGLFARINGGTVGPYGIGTARTFYQTSTPSTPSTGDIWVDSDEVYTTINSNDYALKNQIPAISEPFFLAGM
jgi:hypothetical protein